MKLTEQEKQSAIILLSNFRDWMKQNGYEKLDDITPFTINSYINAIDDSL